MRQGQSCRRHYGFLDIDDSKRIRGDFDRTTTADNGLHVLGRPPITTPEVYPFTITSRSYSLPATHQRLTSETALMRTELTIPWSRTAEMTMQTNVDSADERSASPESVSDCTQVSSLLTPPNSLISNPYRQVSRGKRYKKVEKRVKPIPGT